MSKERDNELDQVEKLFLFLTTGKAPDGVAFGVSSTRSPIRKMSARQAFRVIYVLQEGCHLIHDSFELCHNCEQIFDSESEGSYDEKKGHHFCDSCAPAVRP